MNSENHDWKSFLLDLVSDLTPGAFVSILFLILVILIGLFAPWLAPFDQGEILTNESFEPPSSMLWLGSDFLGRDLLSRLISGVRVTLFLALMITFLSFLLGVGLGFLAAAFGGKVDATISRINDALLSFLKLTLG